MNQKVVKLNAAQLRDIIIEAMRPVKSLNLPHDLSGEVFEIANDMSNVSREWLNSLRDEPNGPLDQPDQEILQNDWDVMVDAASREIREKLVAILHDVSGKLMSGEYYND